MYLTVQEVSESLNWPDAAALIVTLAAVLVLIAIAVAAFVQLRQARLGAAHDEDLRQLVHRYQHLAEGQL
jgi:Tfp pilus assembly protein PilO